MIKKIIPILSMPVFLFTPMVNAQLPHAPNGWYIEGSLANYINNYINNHSSYYAENPLLAGSVGYKKDRWRLEGQYLYQHINIGTCNLYYCSASNISGNKNSLELNGFYDFDNNTIVSISKITTKDIKDLNDFFEKAHAYTFKQLDINGKNVYLVKYNKLVKHNKLGKFVVLDENYKGLQETKEMLDNQEYINFKDCK